MAEGEIVGWHHQRDGHEFEQAPGDENSYPLQYSGLENSMDRGAWQAYNQVQNSRGFYLLRIWYI